MICGLLFFATTVNYIDRQALGILKPTLAKDLHWSESDYGWIVSAFQFAYALTMPLAGRMVDLLGTRLGYALAVLVWSTAAMSHSLARTWGQFVAARFGLGMGEAANFPAAIKTVAEWFPEKERALATGIFNSGSNVGAVAAPLLIPVVAYRLGWRAAFLFTGGLDLIWLVAWLAYYREPAKLQEVSDRTGGDTWRTLLTKRAAWAYIAGKFVTDPVWWFFLFWIPAFLQSTYQLPLTGLGLPLAAIYVAADGGSILGGWLSAGMISRGWTLNSARKTAMLLCACAATPVISLVFVRGLWATVTLIGLAAAAHQGWSANLYTLVSDTFPRRTVGSVIGLGGLVGGLSGILAAPVIGYWLDFSGGAYRPLFVVGGMAYLAALGIIQVLVPKIARPALSPHTVAPLL
jgi:ACS family hexuronate transporter-like MFS transporter